MFRVAKNVSLVFLGAIISLIGVEVVGSRRVTLAPQYMFSPSFAPMLERVLPAVVTLRVTGEAPVAVELRSEAHQRARGPLTPGKREFRTGGSGVIVDAERGFILTNNHVVENATDINVGLSDGRRMTGVLVGRDPGTDLAVVQVNPLALPSIPLGASDGARVGDVVIAVGNPFGLEGTATVGIIGATMRSEIGFEAFEDFLQIDAHIDPGNSGGALVNSAGELIGINTLVGGRKGGVGSIGFAIPIDLAKSLMPELIADGRVRRGSLGLIVENLPTEATTNGHGVRSGAIVTQVIPGSSAAAADIAVGDVIVRVANRPVRSAVEFMSRTAMVPLGKTIQVTISSEGVERHVSMTVAATGIEMPAKQVPAGKGGLSGVRVRDILPGNPIYGLQRGAQIHELPTPMSAAAGVLEVGDVIVAVGGVKIGSTQDLLDRIEMIDADYRLDISRDGVPAWLQLKRQTVE